MCLVYSAFSHREMRHAYKIMRKQYNIYDYQLPKQVNECYGVITVALRDHRSFNEKVSFWGHWKVGEKLKIDRSF